MAGFLAPSGAGAEGWFAHGGRIEFRHRAEKRFSKSWLMTNLGMLFCLLTPKNLWNSSLWPDGEELLHACKTHIHHVFSGLWINTSYPPGAAHLVFD